MDEELEPGYIRIGDWIIGPPYGGDEDMLSIHRTDGEGGDFRKADFAAAIEGFYEDHF